MSWKHSQSKNKTNKRTRLAFIVLALVISLLVVSWTVRFAQNLFNTQRNYVWKGEFNINLVVRAKGISIFSYNPSEEKIMVVDLPDETFVDVPFGFGLWQLGSVYGLGGDQLLTDTLVSYLAIPIDGYLDFGKSPNPKTTAEIISVLRKNPFSGLNLLTSLKTNLTMWELFKLKLGIAAVRFDKIQELDLGKLNVLDKENLPDGTKILNADPVKLDNVLTDLVDPVIISERKSIAIFNATGHPQLALKWARLITNLGGNVIITANAKERLDKTRVFGQASKTLKRLQQIFDLGCQKDPKCDKIMGSEDLVSSRAEVSVFLGEDFANK